MVVDVVSVVDEVVFVDGATVVVVVPDDIVLNATDSDFTGTVGAVVCCMHIGGVTVEDSPDNVVVIEGTFRGVVKLALGTR